MILRPVSPASARGPPSSNTPVGLHSILWRSVAISRRAGSNGRTTCSSTSGPSSVSGSMPGSCWVEISTVSSSTGRPSS